MSRIMETRFWNIISIMLLPLFATPFTIFAYNRDPIMLTLGISAILLDQSTKVIKYLTRNISQRPQGASACDLICCGGIVEGKPGFPSGHMTVSTYIGTILSWYFSPKITLWPYALIFILLTALARLRKKCHSPIQVIAGTIYGALAAGLFIYFANKI